MGGYASNSKYGMVGGMRTVAQMLAYEVPMVFALLGIIMITGSLKMSAIVDAQANVWFIFLQPLAFLIFLITALVESNRPPFNIVEGESEIIAGPFTEYTGMRWALFFLAEFANLLSISIMTTTLFLGGWHGPAFLPGMIWFWIKVLLMVLVFQWIGWTFPRFRIDQMLSFGWKVLLPVALVNVLLTGIGVYIYNWL
jgi:NADH-quinone oxidoreductase subunit H